MRPRGGQPGLITGMSAILLDTDHLHCRACLSSRCTFQGVCPLVQCPNCLVPLHNCKLDDHLENICPDSTIACCNHHYGCSLQLKRHSLGTHLQFCPASMVQCRYAYVREQLKRTLHCEKPTDNESTLSVLQQQYRNDLKTIKAAQKFDPKLEDTCIDLISTECHRHIHHLLPPITDDSFFQGKHMYTSTTYFQYNDASFDFKEKRNHVFVCGLFIRRSDYTDHMKQHDDLCSELSFKIRQCPLYHYGCCFSSMEIAPCSHGSVLLYQPALNACLVTFEQNPTHEISIYNHDLLSVLPIEILTYVVLFLDCYGLWSLSQTCTYLRDICEGYLVRKGIVYSCWKKENGTWILSKRVCNNYNHDEFM